MTTTLLRLFVLACMLAARASDVAAQDDAPDPTATSAPAPAPAPAPPAAAPVIHSPPAAGTATTITLDASIIKAIDAELAKSPKAASSELGQAQSSVAGEALQIAGQIVASRASGAALDLARERLIEGFCSEDADEEVKPKAVFPRTCAIVAAVRIQDLASSGRAMLEALIVDALGHLKARSGITVEEKALLGTMLSFVVPEVIRAAEGKSSTASTSLIARFVMEGYLELLQQRLRDPGTNTLSNSLSVTAGQLAVLMAGLSVRSCFEKSLLKDCKLPDEVRAAAELLKVDKIDILFTAERVASLVIDTLTLKQQDYSDWQGRMHRTIDASFEMACLMVDGRLEGCPAQVPTKAPAKAIEALTAARYFLSAAVRGDVNAVLSAVVGIEACGSNQVCKRGLRIAGTVLQYAHTYEDGGDAAAAHEERVELLEDLSSDMTDRIDREGDDVWSLGGSLQLVLGYRGPFDNDHKGALWGPVALPLGVGFQTVGEGIHLQLNVFDLGQYLSWEAGPKVAEPEIEDALSPSLTAGYAWGTSFPAFAGVTAGYTPSYRPGGDPDARRGSFNVGATVGIYVPLLDIN